MQRFIAVNNHHKSYLASVTIPKSCEDSTTDSSDKSSCYSSSRGVTLLDVHFQSAKTVVPVLDRFLPSALADNDEVWIITGSGHHVAVGHQRREDKTASGGVLYNAVRRYLEEREEDNNAVGWKFFLGKDTSGGKNTTSGGAFLVCRI